MQQLSMHTPDLTQANIDAIAQLFPHVVTEAEDEDGNLTKKIDFDLLRQSLSKDIVEDTTERYRLDRPGKKRALLKANTPLTKTLRPVPEDSVNRDTTQNLYLEGDNFEILKILQESYLGKIKMIYIDPPYNTGKDFVYKDDFKVSKSDYEGELGAVNEEGGKLFKNTDTNGRYHSDWLSMMYSRLTVARDLLKDDGVIFMSIDDNEVHNLRKVADEIFGEENFVVQLIWFYEGVNDNQYSFRKTHEYIIGFAKNIGLLKYNKITDPNVELNEKIENSVVKNGPKNPASLVLLKKGFPCEIEKGIIKKNDVDCVEYNIDLIIENFQLQNDVEVNSGWSSKTILNQFIETNFNPVFDSNLQLTKFVIKKSGNINYIKERGQEYLLSVIRNLGTTMGASELLQKMGVLGFDYPKPVGLLKFIYSIFSGSEDCVLDFFSGSGSSAEAIMQLNVEDGGNRKFIMAQLPEETDPESEAYKAGYKYITEIGKERIRRAGKKILEENKDTLAQRETPLDIGFRVYKTDTTNMKDIYYHPSQIKQSDLGLFTSNIKDDRTPNDLLTQVMLDRGLTLDLPMRETKIGNNTVFYVADNALVACFDEKIDIAIIDQIAVCQPLKVVFRDASFKDVADRINVETRMKRLSPDTQISVI